MIKRKQNIWIRPVFSLFTHISLDNWPQKNRKTEKWKRASCEVVLRMAAGDVCLHPEQDVSSHLPSSSSPNASQLQVNASGGAEVIGGAFAGSPAGTWRVKALWKRLVYGKSAPMWTEFKEAEEEEEEKQAGATESTNVHNVCLLTENHFSPREFAWSPQPLLCRHPLVMWHHMGLENNIKICRNMSQKCDVNIS